MKFNTILYLLIGFGATATEERQLKTCNTALDNCKRDCTCFPGKLCGSVGQCYEETRPPPQIVSSESEDGDTGGDSGGGGGGLKKKSADDTKTKKCFPGSSTIHLANGKTKRLDQVGVGDLVASVDDDGNFEYSPVVYIPHLKNEHWSSFLKISCTEEGGENHIRATEDHVLFISKSKDASFSEASAVPAQDVEVGSWLYTVQPPEEIDDDAGMEIKKCQVYDIEAVTDDSGIYTVFTKNGRLVVEGVVASGYIGGLWILGKDHVGAHYLTSLHRLVYEMGAAESSFFRYLNDFLIFVLGEITA